MSQAPTPDPNCVFCAILAGRLPASLVYRDEHVCAFMDRQPVNPGHVLAVPLRHAPRLSALDPAGGARLFALAQRLAAALYASHDPAGLRCEGVRLSLADGEAAGQEVFHVHLHVVPHFAGDGFGLRFPPGYHHRPPRAALDETAARVRAALAAALPASDL